MDMSATHVNGVVMSPIDGDYISARMRGRVHEGFCYEFERCC